MPNRHETLVIKLISIGLSHDLSRLEQIKYTKEGDATKYTEEEFVKVHRKMFVALVTLGFIVKDYSLRRLCIEAAAVCEPEGVICKKILEQLPPQNLPLKVDDEAMKITLVHLREQLETFQSAIKANVNLSTTWLKSSVLCYENLDFLNRRKVLSDDLKPLEYPGVEKYLKRTRKDSNDEVAEEEEKKKPLNSVKVLEELKCFHEDISERLKRINNPFRPTVDLSFIPPISQEIKAMIFKAFSASTDFEFLRDGEIFIKVAVPFETLKSYHTYFFMINKEQKKKNKAHLFFDFDATKETDMTVTQMYQEGIVRVHDLCCQGSNIFDIENVMLFTIMEKKNLYLMTEFIDLNKNQSVKVAQNPMQSAFFYLTARPIPQLALLCRTTNVGFTSTSVLDYCVDHYTFDATPCRYSYKKKGDEGKSEKKGEDVDLEEADKPTKPKPLRKPPSVSKLVKPPALKIVKQTPPKLVSPPGVARHSHKAKRPPAVELAAGTETFNSSQELINVFLLMENELSNIVGSKVKMDLRQMSDPRSMHNVKFTYDTSSELPVNVSTLRNNKVTPIMTKVIQLPARIHGSLLVTFDTIDQIIYDDNNEPHIRTQKEPKVSGNIIFDHMSHAIKCMNIECTVLSIRSKFVFSMRGGSRSWEKKTKDERKQRESSEQSPSSSCDGMIREIKEEILEPFHDLPELEPPKNGDSMNIKIESNQANFQVPVIVRHESPIRQAPVQVVNPMMAVNGYYATPPSLPSPTMVKNVSPYVQQTQQLQFQESGQDQMMIQIQQQQMQIQHSQMDILQPQIQQPHIQMSQFELHHFTQQMNHQIPITPHPLANQLQSYHHQPILHHHQIHVPELPAPPSQYVQPPPQSPIPQHQNPLNLPPEPSVIVKAIPVSPKSDKFKIISVEGLPPHKMSFSGPLLGSPLHVNGFMNGTSPVKEEPKNSPDAIDFEAELPVTQVVLKPKIEEAPVQEQTPPTSPPPLHYPAVKKEVVEPSHHKKKLLLNPLNVIKEISQSAIKKEIKKESMTASADRILNNTPPNDTADVIDLTDEAIDHDHCESPPLKKIHHDDLDPLAINFVDMGEMPSSGIDMGKCNLDKEYSRVMKKVGMKKMGPSGPKRPRINFNEDQSYTEPQTRKVEVVVEDFIKEMNATVFQKDMNVKAKPHRLKVSNKVSSY
jgi:hypothetical protein